MGKKKNKGASTDSADLSKKERKALEAKAAELQAAIAAKKAEKKAKGKPGKKGKKKPKGDTPAPLTAEERAALSPSKAAAAEAAEPTELAAAEAVLESATATPDEQKAARKVKSEALAGMSPEELKARVEEKRAAREEHEATASEVDRTDQAAVKAYNAKMVALGGGRLLTPESEVAARAEAISEEAPMPNSLADVKRRKAKADELVVELDGEHLAAPEQVVEAVETDRGTIYTAGDVDKAFGITPGPDGIGTFGKPSEAPHDANTLEEGRNGYKIKVLAADGTVDPKKVLQFTRATTYISGLESTKTLEDWKMRTLLEGVALNDTNPERREVEALPDSIVAEVRDLMHRREVKLAKARKSDRKGKLDAGELATVETAAHKEFKDAVNKIAEAALELGGVHEKANAGTDMHAVCQAFDTSGLSVEEWVEAQEAPPTSSQVDSLLAYDKAMRAAGIKVMETEVVVVNDELKVAGRADAVYMVKLPGTQRAVRVIGDIKTGRIDLGAGKIGQQLALYTSCDRYDLETGERTKLGTSKSVGIVVHLPQGTGTCTIHIVDLTLGARGNKIAGEVRAWRNEGKKAIDMSVNLAAVAS